MKNRGTIISNIIIVALLLGFASFIVFRTTKQNSTKTLIIQAEVQYDDPIYHQIDHHQLPFAPDAFFADHNYLYLSKGHQLSIHNLNGKQLTMFQTSAPIVDILLLQKSFYILHQNSIEVMSRSGKLMHIIKAPTHESLLTSITALSDTLYVSDRGQFKVLKFHKNGQFHGSIESPYQFIAPSGYMALTNQNNQYLWCVNPGRHQLEKYSMSGKFISSFGSAGAKPGAFSGCCNPCGIQFTEDGDVITSEKGTPRISLYSNRGIYLGHIYAAKQLTDGHEAMLIQYQNKTLYIIQNQKLMKFQSSIDQS